MNAKSICVAGVDGTGKSTVVSLLYEKYFPEAKVQYMGLKNWETKIAQFTFKESKFIISRMIKKIIKPIAVICDLRHRVYKYRKSSDVIIFDRYTDEQILQYAKYGKSLFNRPAEWLYILFLRKFMYQPSLIVYLYCSEDTSLSRKNDIISDEEIRRFKKSKKVMDNYYMNKNAIKINTEEYTQDQVAELIYDNFIDICG